MSASQERAGNWSAEETVLLLDIWGKPDIQKEMLGTCRNLETYNHISNLIQENRPGFHRNGVQCRYRIKRLSREYRRAKKEGAPSSFPFFEQMDKIVAERSKLAEWHNNMKFKKKLCPQYLHGNSGIKIEIDYAEDYKYALSGCSKEHQSSSHMASGGCDFESLDTASDDPDDHDDSFDGHSDSQDCDMSGDAHRDDACPTVPVSGPDNSTGVSAQEEEACGSGVECQPSTARDSAGSLGGTGSFVDHQQSEAESSPPPFVITSVCHVENAESLSCGEEETTAADEDVSKERSCASAEEGDCVHGEKPLEPWKPGAGGHGVREDGKHIEDTHMELAEELCMADSAPSRVASQMEKDLQLIAEYHISTPPPLPDTVPAPAAPSGVSAAKKKCGKIDSDLPVPDQTSTVVSARDTPHLSHPPQDAALKASRRPQYRVVEAGGIHTLVKVPDADSSESRGGSGGPPGVVVASTSARPAKSLMPKVVVVSSGMPAVLKPGVSLLSSSHRPQNAPAVGPSQTKATACNSVQVTPGLYAVQNRHQAAKTVSKTFKVLHPHRSLPILVQRPSDTPSSSQPILVSFSHLPKITSAPSVPVRKILEARRVTAAPKTAGSPSPGTKLTSPGSLPESESPLTFTTLSSIDPVPKKKMVSAESQSALSSSLPSSQTLAIITPPMSLSAQGSGPDGSGTTPPLAACDVKSIKTEDPDQHKSLSFEPDSHSAQKRPHELSETHAHSCIKVETESPEQPPGHPRPTTEQEATHSKPFCPTLAKKRKVADTTKAPGTGASECGGNIQPQPDHAETPAEDRQAHTPRSAAGAEDLPPPSTPTPARPPIVTPRQASTSEGQTTLSSRQGSLASLTEGVILGSQDKCSRSGLRPGSCLTRKEENELFQLLLPQTQLSEECQRWMLQTLLSRNCSGASCGGGGATGRQQADASRSGSAVEVTSLASDNHSGSGTVTSGKEAGRSVVKVGLTQLAKGGVVMEVGTPEEASIAEQAGACAVVAVGGVPADLQRQGEEARMADPKVIREIMAAVTIPVVAKCRIGHFAEAQILEALGVDMVDESEVLTPVDVENHVDKHAFKVPFVCGARDLGEALRRVNEGAAMIRTRREDGTGGMAGAVRQARTISRQIRTAQVLEPAELHRFAEELQAPFDLLKKTVDLGRLPVLNLACGGVATPADVSLLMQLGMDGVIVDSGIFQSPSSPHTHTRARALAQAAMHHKHPRKLAALSEGLGEAVLAAPAVGQKRPASASASSSGSQLQENVWNARPALDTVQGST